MQSIQVTYQEATRSIETIGDAKPEPWDEVCKRFENDVSRIMDVSDQNGYSALYVCYDEDNQPIYYLVKEDKALDKLRQKTFLSKLGRA